MARRQIDKWLVACSDPERLVATGLASLSPLQARALIDAAETHGTLPAVTRACAPLAYVPGLHGIHEDAKSRRVAAVAMSMVLRRRAQTLIKLAGPLPVRIVKGPAFADELYDEPVLRTFTDIDLLVAADASPMLASILADAGYERAERSIDGTETKWLHRLDASLVEVHTNLVHNARLRRTISLTFADLVDLRPAVATFAVAAIHGAADGFRRVRQVVDLCQAARKLTPADEPQLGHALTRIGAGLASVIGLRLAYRMFGERRCRELERAIEYAPLKSAALSLLLSPAVVTSFASDMAFLQSWRRQLYRVLLEK